MDGRVRVREIYAKIVICLVFAQWNHSFFFLFLLWCVRVLFRFVLLFRFQFRMWVMWLFDSPFIILLVFSLYFFVVNCVLRYVVYTYFGRAKVTVTIQNRLNFSMAVMTLLLTLLCVNVRTSPIYDLRSPIAGRNIRRIDSLCECFINEMKFLKKKKKNIWANIIRTQKDTVFCVWALKWDLSVVVGPVTGGDRRVSVDGHQTRQRHNIFRNKSKYIYIISVAWPNGSVVCARRAVSHSHSHTHKFHFHFKAFLNFRIFRKSLFQFEPFFL